MPHPGNVTELRSKFLAGATASELVRFACEIVPGLTESELEELFWEAFELPWDSLIAEAFVWLHSVPTGLDSGHATSVLIPAIIREMPRWLPAHLRLRPDDTPWMTEPPPAYARNPAFLRHPLIEEWDQLSASSQEYLWRQQLNAWILYTDLSVVAALAERIANRTDGANG